jgi:hypothetical protein
LARVLRGIIVYIRVVAIVVMSVILNHTVAGTIVLAMGYNVGEVTKKLACVGGIGSDGWRRIAHIEKDGG